jgi:hypothetical protein
MVGWTAKILLGGASYAAFLWWRLGVLRGAVKRCKTVGPRWLARAMAGFSKGVASLAGVRVASLSGPGLDASVDKSKPFTYVCFCRRYRHVPSEQRCALRIASPPGMSGTRTAS